MLRPLAAAVASATATAAIAAQVAPAPGATPGAPATPNAPTVPAVPAAPAPRDADERRELPELPATPAPILEIVSAKAFSVEQPWPTDWRADHAMVRQGWIAVLRVPHDFVVPRQTQEPVLFAGGTTVERVENLIDSGLVLAIVPATPGTIAVPGSRAGESEAPRPLGELAIWYGTPALPESLDGTAIAREVVLAERARIGARPAAEVERALARGGDAISVADRAALLEALAALGSAAPRPR